MDHPSNGVSILGCLRPTFADEGLYIRSSFHCEDSGSYSSEWKDGDILSFNSKNDGSSTGSTLYRLEIMRMELFSVYGSQSAIGVLDFQVAEPDVLAHSTSAILEHFSEKGSRCNIALKALCKKKGLQVEGANLIGVDSLGMDVRIFSGVEARTHRFPFEARTHRFPFEARTHRFPFKTRATSEVHQLLFPRSHRKKFRTYQDGLADSSHFSSNNNGSKYLK